MEKAEQIYFENGITTIQEGLTKRDEWNLLLRMSEEGRLKSDVVCYADLKDHRTLFKESGARQNRYMGRLKMGGYKIFLDGSPQGRTAWLREPYLKGDAGYRGYPIYRGRSRDFLRSRYRGQHQEDGRSFNDCVFFYSAHLSLG